MEKLAVKILSVEDNPGDMRLLQEALKDAQSIQCEWVSVANLAEAIQIISSVRFDVILLDLSLPDSSGLDTLIKIKPHAGGVPIVIMSGLDNEKVALEALDKGAQDYLVKGQVDGNTLARTLRYAIQRKQTQEALRESQERYEQQLIYNAFHDSLTGLPSRLLLINRLTQSIERLNRIPHYCFAVLFLDLDRFKIINDGLGHVLGDKLLIEVSRRLLRGIREVDTVTLARVGGDEFIILTDYIKGAVDAVRIADRIKMNLKDSFTIEGYEVFTRASIGIAVSSSEYKNPEDMIRDADTAMYRAKASGGGGYQLFDQDMHTRAMAILEFENNLHRAVNSHDFILHYQPIVSLTNGRIVGVEALIRWPHNEKGFIMPSEFIDLAEETGLIVAMGEWVMKTACGQLKQWQKEFPGDPSLRMSVNVSYRQLIQSEFMEMIERTLKETGIKHGLCLEITETGIMKNPDFIIPLITRLKERNVQIHLDDFGVGYSSLYYLHHFKIDKLKIDRSFVSGITSEGDHCEILKTIIALAQNLKIDVIAEGIETPVQLKCLRDLKCQYGQGYYFSKALDKDKITSFIQNGFIDLEKGT